MLRRVIRSLVDPGVRQLGRSPAAPAGVIALTIILYWSARDGATDPLVWIPGSLMLVGLLVVVAWMTPGPIPGGRAGVVALVGFAAYVSWCFASIAWADVRADAWSGANATLVYFVVYALFAIRPWRSGAAQAFLGAYSVGVAGIGIWALLRLDDADRRTASFIAGRFAEPISYANANCALFAGATIPALFLASRREMPVVLRGVFLGSAGVLAQLMLLCQSRMSLLAFPIVLVVFVAVVPNRLRLLFALLVVGVVVAISMPSLLAVFEALLSAQGVLEAIVDAQRAVLMSGMALAFIGIGWGLLDRRFEMPARLLRVVGVAVVVLAICGGVVSAAIFAERYGSPVSQAAIWWDRFKADEYVSEPGTPHLVSGFGGAGRYDIWKVALKVFERHPVVGVGVDNFGVDWLRERPNERDLVSPHSVELRVLQQTGLVGATLLSTFLVAAFIAGWGALRRGTPATRGTAAAGLLLFVYWGAHGSVDWLWEIPALSAAAFAALGLVVAFSPTPRQRPARRWIVPAAVSVLGASALITLVPPWLSARQIETALEPSRIGSGAAYAHLDRARSLNPITDEPDVLAAVIAAGQGDTGRQRRFLVRALERNPYNWYPYLELGLIDAKRNGRAAGVVWLEKARALNPQEATIRFAIDRVRAGRLPTRAEMDELFVRSAETCCVP